MFASKPTLRVYAPRSPRARKYTGALHTSTKQPLRIIRTHASANMQVGRESRMTVPEDTGVLENVGSNFYLSPPPGTVIPVWAHGHRISENFKESSPFIPQVNLFVSDKDTQRQSLTRSISVVPHPCISKL